MDTGRAEETARGADPFWWVSEVLTELSCKTVPVRHLDLLDGLQCGCYTPGSRRPTLGP